MDNEEKSPEFGRYLRNHRRSKGISLEVVSQKTKITLASLRQLEEEELDKLPAPTFVKGFIRAYAEVVGVDVNEAIASPPAVHFRQIPGLVHLDRQCIRLYIHLGWEYLCAGWIPAVGEFTMLDRGSVDSRSCRHRRRFVLQDKSGLIISRQ